MTHISHLRRRASAAWHKVRFWCFLRPRVSGRLKLRGDVTRIHVDPSFRCDGDLWLGVHAEEGTIAIAAGVSASGPLIITAVRPLAIGAGTLFGPNVLVTDHYHGDVRDPVHRDMRPSLRPLYSPGGIDIGEDVQLGANSVVLAPARVNRGVIVAAGAVVKGDVAAMTIYTGLPSTRNARRLSTDMDGE